MGSQGTTKCQKSSEVFRLVHPVDFENEVDSNAQTVSYSEASIADLFATGQDLNKAFASHNKWARFVVRDCDGSARDTTSAVGATGSWRDAELASPGRTSYDRSVGRVKRRLSWDGAQKEGVPEESILELAELQEIQAGARQVVLGSGKQCISESGLEVKVAVGGASDARSEISSASELFITYNSLFDADNLSNHDEDEGAPDLEAGEGCRPASPSQALRPRPTEAKVSVDMENPQIRVSLCTGVPEPARHSIAASRPLGMYITVEDLRYSQCKPTRWRRFPKKPQKMLLDGVSAYFAPGQMAAILGPSGAGKTTFLDLLAGRTTAGTAMGQVLFDGQAATRRVLQQSVGYVEQHDTLLAALTVREMLLYTAELKCPQGETLSMKLARVEDLLSKLKLESCQHTQIGNNMARGISGGQVKRTNLGIALITNPLVLLMDEPTSGLDSYTAHEVMLLVRNTAMRGITVLATIHQPSAATFNLFDRLLILINGRTAYFGPNGPPAEEYFQFQRHGQPDGTGRRPALDTLELRSQAEWFISITGHAAKDADTAELLLQSYQSSQQRKTADKELGELLSLRRAGQGKEADRLAGIQVWGRAERAPFLTTCSILLRYRTWANYRSPLYWLSRTFEKLMLVLLLSTTYIGVGRNFDPANINNLTSIMFILSVMPPFVALPYLPSILQERATFLREQADGVYTVLAYLTVKVVEELGMVSLGALLSIVAIYYAVGLPGSLLLYWLLYCCTLGIGVLMGYFFAAISPSLDVAAATLPAFLMSLVFFAGYLIRWKDMKPWWQWYGTLNPVHYNFRAVMLNAFEDKDVVAFATGETVLEFYGMKGMNKYANLGYQSTFFVAFFALTWLALRLIKHQKR